VLSEILSVTNSYEQHSYLVRNYYRENELTSDSGSQRNFFDGTIMKLRQLGGDEVQQGLDALGNWTLDPLGRSIHKEWKFDSFRTAIDFLLEVADVAEVQDHHPDFYSSYKKIKIKLMTHDVGGLSDKDFVLAADIDRLEANFPHDK